jgi:hypothetical protein
MTATVPRRLAWLVWWTVLAAGALRVALVLDDWSGDDGWAGSLQSECAFVAVIVTFPLVGLAILVRQPGNRVGWMLHAVGLAWAVSWLLDAYARLGLVIEPGSVPGAGVAAAVNEGSWTWGLIAMGFYLVLLFPDGRLPSPRWRWLAWVIGAAALVVQVAITLRPGELVEAPVEGMRNPIGLEALEGPLNVLLALSLPFFPIGLVAAAASLALRFRRSQGIERAQVKWLATAGAVVAAVYVATVTSTLVTELLADNRDANVPPLAVRLLENTSVLTFGLLPWAIGAAILRYRLYDIDLVINRTLVYAALTATLAVAYLTSVLVLRVALDPFTGGSDLAVAASTLAVAALFRPLRSRIQSLVDRRFYRARYDAARTLETFAAHLRDELDLESVQRDLRGVVHDTVQPTQVSLWLRGSAR